MSQLSKRFLGALIILLVLPLAASAQNPIVPCGPHIGVECTVQHLGQLLVSIYNFLLFLAGFIAMLFIVFAAIRMLIFYIGESPENELSAAKVTFRRAVFGLLIVLAAYLLVNTLILFLGGGSIADITKPIFGP